LSLSLSRTHVTLLSFILTIVSIRSISIGSVFIENATAQSSSYRELRKKDADKLFSLARKQSVAGDTYAYIEKTYRQALAIYKEIGEYRSEIKTLVRLAEIEALRFRHGKAVEILRQAIQIAQLSGDRKSELEILFSNLKFGDLIEDRDIMLVLQYLILRDPLSISLDERFLYLISLDESFFLQNPQYNYCILYSYIGDAYFGKKLYPQAAEAYKKAVEGYTNALECPKREPRDLWFKNELLIQLGFTHKLMRQEVQAQTALDEALGYFDGSVNKNTSKRVMSDGLFTNFITIAVAKNSDKLLQKVFRIHRDYFNNNFGDWNSISTIKHLGKVYELLGKYDLAIIYYKQALDYTQYPQNSERYAQQGIKLISNAMCN
jgi:tetratricopeptide (TPR) repeat protein